MSDCAKYYTGPIAPAVLHKQVDRSEYAKYYTDSIASVIKPPNGEVIVDSSLINPRQRLLSRDLGPIVLGQTLGYGKILERDENGIAFVTMNELGYLIVPEDEIGVIATNHLAGCSGAAGFARQSDGSVKTFVSHYDPLLQMRSLTGRTTPFYADIASFYSPSSQKTDYVVAYPSSDKNDPTLLEDDHYLNVCRYVARSLGNNVRLLFIPYEDEFDSHTLASGRMGDYEGIFWDGRPIDFGKYIGEQPIDKHM